MTAVAAFWGGVRVPPSALSLAHARSGAIGRLRHSASPPIHALQQLTGDGWDAAGATGTWIDQGFGRQRFYYSCTSTVYGDRAGLTLPPLRCLRAEPRAGSLGRSNQSREEPDTGTVACLGQHSRVNERTHNGITRDLVNTDALLCLGRCQREFWCFEETALHLSDEGLYAATARHHRIHPLRRSRIVLAG